jgi:hypothetical protein
MLRRPRAVAFMLSGVRFGTLRLPDGIELRSSPWTFYQQTLNALDIALVPLRHEAEDHRLQTVPCDLYADTEHDKGDHTYNPADR